MKTKEITMLVLLFVFCLDLCLLYNVTDLDIWVRLAVGKLCLELGNVSFHDIFAYTPTKPLWVDHEWGSGVVFFLAADTFGQTGLLCLRVLLFFGTILFLHLCVKERVENPNGLLLHFLLAYVLLFGFEVTVRSHAFTYFFFALWLYLLERSRKGKNRGLLLLPPTMLVWGNLHGGFVAGLGLLFLYGAGEFLNRKAWGKYLVLLVLCFAVTLVNPYGIRYWGYLSEALTMHRPEIIEWRPFDFLSSIRSRLGFKLLFLLSGVLLVVNGVRKVKIDRVDVLLLFVTGFLAVRHLRHIPFFTMACFPFVYCSCRELWGRVRPERIAASRVGRFLGLQRLERLGPGALHGFLLTVLVLVVWSQPVRIRVPSSTLPLHAFSFIRGNGLEGNLLTEFNWGSFAVWELFPFCKVSIDGRYEEVYPDETYYDIFRFTNGMEGWEEALKKYRNDMILVRKKSPINLRMKKIEEEWGLVYEDHLSMLYLPKRLTQRSWTLPGKDPEARDSFSTEGRASYIAETKR